MSSEEDRINNLIGEARVLEGALNELASRQNLMERILIESRTSVETINGINPGADEMLIPVGGGVMLRATPPSVEKVLVNIGSNVVVEKPKEEAIKIMEQRIKGIEEDLVALVNQRNQIAARLEQDRRAIQSFLDRQGK